MKTLDDLVMEAVRSGRLKSLTFWTTGRGYQANASRDNTSWRCETHSDPVTALRRVLGASEIADDGPVQEDIFG